jgi:hypothetical protein
MGAMLALEERYTIQMGTPLRLRYAVYVHAGMPDAAAIDAVWKRFSTEPLRPELGPPKLARDCRHGDHRMYTVPRSFTSQQDCESFLQSGK